jgi:dolichol kinase
MTSPETIVAVCPREAIALESIAQWGLDNLTLPLGTALLTFWINLVLPGD